MLFLWHDCGESIAYDDFQDAANGAVALRNVELRRVRRFRPAANHANRHFANRGETQNEPQFKIRLNSEIFRNNENHLGREVQERNYCNVLEQQIKQRQIV